MFNLNIVATLDVPAPELRPLLMDRILVIEHDGAMLKILKRLFSSEGYKVDVVPSGQAGLDALRQTRPAAVVLDLPFPASSGCDLCGKISKMIPGLPLVILSTSANVADKVLLMDMGADDYVTIPFSPKDLIKRLDRLIQRPLRFPSQNLYVSEGDHS
jgi:DNA-binding response OmpR family regulator